MTNPFWPNWAAVALLARIFFAVLIFVGAYTLFSASVVLGRLRSLTIQRPPEDSCALEHSLSDLEVRLANTRELLGATFYLFALILMLVIWGAYNTYHTVGTPAAFILNNLEPYIPFAVDVFLVLLALHCLQWFVFHRVRARRNKLTDRLTS
jgi:hypothetical protein